MPKIISIAQSLPNFFTMFSTFYHLPRSGGSTPCWPISARSSFHQIHKRKEDFRFLEIWKERKMGEIEKEIENSPEKELESENENKNDEPKVIPGVIYVST